MKRLLVLVLLSGTLALSAQPGDTSLRINKQAYNQAFLHCVTNEKHFASYAVDAQQYGFELQDEIKCKLHIPTGFHQIWQNIEKDKQHKKGNFNYSKDFWVGIRFNFYVYGKKVSSAYQEFEKSSIPKGPFSFYFDLVPDDFSAHEGGMHAAYAELLKNVKPGHNQIVIQAVMPSKDFNRNHDVPIISGGFLLSVDKEKLEQWKQQFSESQNPAPGVVEIP